MTLTIDYLLNLLLECIFLHDGVLNFSDYYDNLNKTITG